MKKPIIFTDLDGTLLDYTTYSFDMALPALRLLREENIPLIICSSKTAEEVKYYREKIDNHHPFTSENGGGIYIPRGYFAFDILTAPFEVSEEKNYHIVRLGAHYSDLRRAIEEIRGEGFAIRGFGDMAVQEVSDIANMSIEEATMAKERDFDEPFIFEGGEEETRKLFETIISKGFHYTKGRFFHILGSSDKGKAVSILVDLYAKEFGEVTTIALGDGPNDVPMLEKVEYPIIVQRSDKTYAVYDDIPNLRKIDGIGPEGWNKAVIALISEIARER